MQKSYPQYHNIKNIISRIKNIILTASTLHYSTSYSYIHPAIKISNQTFELETFFKKNIFLKKLKIYKNFLIITSIKYQFKIINTSTPKNKLPHLARQTYFSISQYQMLASGALITPNNEPLV